jgi:toxin ParE1/3/4
VLPVVWLPSAEEDLELIITYIAELNPTAARKLKARLEDALLPLSEHPYLYRSSERVQGVRELVAHPNYIIVYRITTSAVEVVSVLHARQEYPKNSL